MKTIIERPTRRRRAIDRMTCQPERKRAASDREQVQIQLTLGDAPGAELKFGALHIHRVVDLPKDPALGINLDAIDGYAVL